MSYSENSCAKREVLELGARAEVKVGMYCGEEGKEENFTLETKPAEC